MLIRLLLTNIFFVATLNALAQVNMHAIKEQAEIMTNALINNEYDTFCDHKHPKVVESLGGREKMIELIKRGKLDLENQGISLARIIFTDSVKVVSAGDELHGLLSYTQFMTVPKGVLKSTGYLLATSKDNGKFWYFIDTIDYSFDQLKDLIPNYNPELRLPPKEKPVLVPF